MKKTFKLYPVAWINENTGGACFSAWTYPGCSDGYTGEPIEIELEFPDDIEERLGVVSRAARIAELREELAKLVGGHEEI